jgi:hypothetical protein
VPPPLFCFFGPENIFKKLSIYDFTQNYRPWLSIVFILASAPLIVTIAIEITKWAKRWWRERQFYNRMSERLDSLTEDGKQILRFYIAEQTRSNVLRIDDGIVQGLVSAGIIYRAASVGNMLEGFSYNISDFAWNYLCVNPHLREGTTSKYRTDKRKRRYSPNIYMAFGCQGKNYSYRSEKQKECKKSSVFASDFLINHSLVTAFVFRR